jgi:PEP-CTERM motif
MKQVLLASVAVLTIVAFGFQQAQATILTFDDLAGNTSAVPNGYGGFNWNNQTTVGSLDSQTGTYQNTGYGAGTVSGTNVIYNWGGSSPVEITLAGAGTFTYNGAYFTAAWVNETVSFTGLLNGVVLDTSGAYAINTSTPEFIALNWSGINELIISNTGAQWAMDNFTFNAATKVPEPVSMALLGVGMIGTGVMVRRRQPTTTAG